MPPIVRMAPTRLSPFGGCGSFASMSLGVVGTLLLDLLNSYAGLAAVGHYSTPSSTNGSAPGDGTNSSSVGEDGSLLAAVALGTMTFNICLLSTTYGLASALDTLLPAAHTQWSSGGSKAHPPPHAHTGRTHVRWTVAVLLLAGLPLGAICVCGPSVLRALGQPPVLADTAGRFSRVLALAAAPPLVLLTVQRKVVNATGVSWPTLVGSLLGTAAQVAWLYAAFWEGEISGNGELGPGLRGLFMLLGLDPRTDRYLAAALGKAVYGATSATFAAGYLIARRDAVCPLGCCPSGGCARRQRRGWEGKGDSLSDSLSEKMLVSVVVGEEQRDDGRGADLDWLEQRSRLVDDEAARPLPGGASSVQGSTTERGTLDNKDRASTRSTSSMNSSTYLKRRLWVVVALAVPSMASMIAEWWSAELRALLCGVLPPWSLPTLHLADNSTTSTSHATPGTSAFTSPATSPELLRARTQAVAVNAVLFVLSVVAYQLPKGMGIATGVRVGGALGIGKAGEARRALRQGLAASVGLVLLSSMAYYYWIGEAAPRLLSSSEAVVIAASSHEARLALAVCMNGFGLLITCQFVLNACGRNSQGTLVAFVGCWVVGVTMGAWIGFGNSATWQRQGLLGLWYGNAAGMCGGGLLGMIAVARLDMERECERRRASTSGGV